MDSVNQKYYDLFVELEAEYDECLELLSSVEIMTDNKLFVHYQKKQKQLADVVLKFKEYKKLCEECELSKELADVESSETEKAELSKTYEELLKKAEDAFEELKQVYFEKGNKENQKSKIEISLKTGDSAFVTELKTLFENFADQNSFEVEVVSETETQISMFVSGENSFEKLKAFQGAIKKIQNTNETNVLVVVLLDGAKEIEIKEEDIVIEISKSSGAGGQHINKTESAVKLIHLPTGITAECQDERSQGKNKEKAMVALKEKILQKSKENNEKYIKNQRNSLKNAIFSETPVLIFDYDRNKVSDNRTKKTYGLKEILGGNINLIASDLSV